MCNLFFCARLFPRVAVCRCMSPHLADDACSHHSALVPVAGLLSLPTCRGMLCCLSQFSSSVPSIVSAAAFASWSPRGCGGWSRMAPHCGSALASPSTNSCPSPPTVTSYPIVVATTASVPLLLLLCLAGRARPCAGARSGGPTFLFDSTLERNKSLQIHMLPILSLNAPNTIPGGQTTTKSLLLEGSFQLPANS